MRILDGEAGASTFKVNLRVWKEGPPGPGPPGLVTWCGDWRHPNCPGHFQRNKEGRRTPREPHWKRSLLWSKMHFSRKWRMIPWFSKTCKGSILFWRHVEASSLWGQWWEGTVLKTIQHSLLEGAEDGQCTAQGCCGLETPLSSGIGGVPWAPHWASGVSACSLQTFIRYIICKHLVPFWMVDLFPYSFCAQHVLFWRSLIHLFCLLLFVVLVADLRNHGQIQSHEVFLSCFLLWGV